MNQDDNDQLILEALLNPVSECYVSFTEAENFHLPKIIFMAYEFEGSNKLIVKESCVFEG